MAIQSVNYNYNPFALSTAQSAWGNKESSLPKRLFAGVVGAVYDMYAKNPYDLTIGNCKKLYNAPEPQSKGTKIAVIATVAFSSLYILMLYGTTIHVNGRAFLALGSKTGLSAISKVGEAFKTFGKNLFIAGAVPIYGLFYVLPKHIIRAIPKVVKLVADKVEYALKWVFEQVLTPLWKKVIFPAAEAIFNCFRFVAAKLNTLLKAVWDKVASAANWIFQNVLTPLWDKVLYPSLKAIDNAICFIATKIGTVLHVIEQKVALAADWVFQNVIAPAWNKVVFPVIKAVTNGITLIGKTFVQTMEKASSYVLQNIIRPVFNGLGSLALTVGKFLNDYVISPLGTAFAVVSEKVAHVFSIVYNNVVVPTAHGIASGFTALGNAIVELKVEVSQTIISIWERLF